MSSAFTVVRNFIKQDFKLAGVGYYSAVFESNVDPNIVYKVGRTLKDPFLDYISMPRLKHNPHFPRVLSLHKDYDNYWYMATIEALTPIPEHKKTLAKTVRDSVHSLDKVSLPEQLKQLLNEVVLFAENDDSVSIDLHSGNIMMRGNTLVITDPLAEHYLYTASDMENWFEQRKR